ncbi:MAG: 5'-methylthioadenosine/S-adenosylhomocysteine nucleosidase [Erysipelotrichaceae bacterium]|nr:5'-methylthioadenosine/S-adenosylhomocysteine nucleosidase [Erysipelotrichaceae bacterium]
MKIGIVIAIAKELKAFLESDYIVEEIKEDYKEVYKTSVNSNTVYAIKSGCGEIDAACATQYLITKYDVDVIINFGVTGAIVKDLNVADLFVVKGAVNHDYDVSPVDPLKPHQYEEFKDIYIPLDEELIKLVKTIKPDIKECNVASGDRFVEKIEDKNNLAKLGCEICDMEIAAIARTSFLNKKPCVSIKCISDSLEGSGIDFMTNVNRSAALAFEVIQKLLLKL